MKVGTITFHGSHNYGSVLQAYALQEYTKKLLDSYHVPCEYQILNYRSKLQKDLYSAPGFDSLVNILKTLMYIPYKKQLDIQHRKFESFIAEYLQTTEEFSSVNGLNEIASRFDILMAGSDQIWNVRAKDFSFAYLFPGCSARKISYAASLGPLKIDWERYDENKFKELLDRFSLISTREKMSRDMLFEVSGQKEIEILPDPVLLLDVHEWRKIQSDVVPGKMRPRIMKPGNMDPETSREYIFFYCLEPSGEHIRIARILSKKLGLPVVTAKYRNRYDYINPFIKRYDAGPCDFLSLIDHSAVVLTSSFHGTLFSMIYGKPFYVINGMEDGRIRDILTAFHAEKNNIPYGIREIFMRPEVQNTEKLIAAERNKAKQYLIKALGISE